jgi:flavin reductase (DIM6/NTAB) family NADH-FMN oxidoreductase RutF
MTDTMRGKGMGKCEAVTANHLRLTLRRHAASVVVVTARGDRPVGVTATSFTSVSLEPPMVSFCLSSSSSTWSVFHGVGHVGIHLLTEAQDEIARTFATSGIDRFARCPSWRVGPYGVPLIDGTAAWLICRVIDLMPAGDHTIVLAQPVLARYELGPAPPLIYYMGGYRGLR